MTPWTPVTSSAIRAIRQTGNDLDVWFRDGRAARYYGAGYLCAQMLRSSSKGSHLHWFVKTGGWSREHVDWDYITP